MLFRDQGAPDPKSGKPHRPTGRLAVATYRLPDWADPHHLRREGAPLPDALAPRPAPQACGSRCWACSSPPSSPSAPAMKLVPLRRLTEAVSRFDGREPEPAPLPQGAPELRRLAQAVQAMQERIAGLMAERSLLIGAISHDLKTYLTRMRLRAEGVAESQRRDRLIVDLDAMAALIDTSLASPGGRRSARSARRSISATSWPSRSPSTPPRERRSACPARRPGV